jgi:hypothetical protein
MQDDLAVKHGAEFRRCLLHCDIIGLMAIHRHTSPHLKELSVADAWVALHIARVDVSNFPFNVRQYSIEWLKDHGFEKIDGQWQRTAEYQKKIFAQAVGISSNRAGGTKTRFNREVEKVMSDAVLNSLAKGITEPQMQRESMMKARAKLRFKNRLD